MWWMVRMQRDPGSKALIDRLSTPERSGGCVLAEWTRVSPGERNRDVSGRALVGTLIASVNGMAEYIVSAIEVRMYHMSQAA